MIPVLTPKQIKATDAYTIANEPISSMNLMDRAVDCLLPNFLKLKNKNFHIICGTGNNGGDGVVLARKLWYNSVYCKVTIIKSNTSNQADNFIENLSILKQQTDVPIKIIQNSTELELNCNEVIVDAIFGNGLNSILKGEFLKVVQLINKSDAEVYSIDMPSGLMSIGETPLDCFIHSVKTFVIEIPRLSLFNPTHKVDFELIDIGLDKEFIKHQSTDFFVIEDKDVKIKKRSRFSFKNSFGHLLIVGGSKGMYGAPTLSAKAGFKCGAGLVSCLIPSNGNDVVYSHLMEVMLQNVGEDFLSGSLPNLQKYNAIAVGMGMGQKKESFAFLSKLLDYAEVPVVIDADALNMLSSNYALGIIKPNSILTPHLGEFKRLVGDFHSENEKLDKLRKLANQTRSIIILKGTYTAIATPEGNIYFNITGNASLATAGSGDVLSGMIGSLLAQGYSPLEAAKRAVFYHGKAGEQFANVPVRASEIIDTIQLY